MRYWLMKSEPDVFGINDLKRVKRESWDGVRNYRARNFMRDDMKVGDKVLFYHSNAKPPGVAGIAVVSRESHPDHTSWDPGSKYHDPKSTEDEPRWFMVEVEFAEAFDDVVSLAELREVPGLEEMMVIQKGIRLSIQPVSKAEFNIVRKLGRAK